MNELKELNANLDELIEMMGNVSAHEQQAAEFRQEPNLKVVWDKLSKDERIKALQDCNFDDKLYSNVEWMRLPGKVVMKLTDYFYKVGNN